MNTNEDIKAKAIIKIIEEVDDLELRDRLLRDLTVRNGQKEELEEARHPEQEQHEPPALRERLSHLKASIQTMPPNHKIILLTVMTLGVAILLSSLYLISQRLVGFDFGTMEPDFTWLILVVVALFVFKRFKAKR